MISKVEAKERALESMRERETGVLATVSISGQPQSSTVYYTFDEDFSIYFIVSHHSEKFKNLTVNRRASFTIGFGPEYREITIRGDVTMIEGNEMREGALEKIAERVSSPVREWPIFAVESLREGGTALFKITPDFVAYLDLGSDTFEVEDSKYIYQLIP